MDSEPHHGLHHQLGTIDVTWAYSPEDIEPAKGALALIVGDQPKRVLMLDAVVRWPESAWTAMNSMLRECGFERTKPGHLAALQWLIDQACEAAEKAD